MLRGLVITGCRLAAVTVYREGQHAVLAPGGAAFPAGARLTLERVTFDRVAGSALLLEAGTAAALHGCLLRTSGGAGADSWRDWAGATSPPEATYPVVWARAGSSLAVAGSRFTGNLDLGIVFEGGELQLRTSAFTDNADAGVKAVFEAPEPALFSGAPPPARAAVRVAGCVFRNNTSKRGPGGAVVLMAGAVASIRDTVFERNAADAGALRARLLAARGR